MSALFNNYEIHVLEVLRRLGPLAAFKQLMAENDALIRSSRLDIGREITSARTAIYTTIVAEWAETLQRTMGYTKPFAVVALGGTGRGEVTPCSDQDLAFVLEGEVAGNAFVEALLRQTSDTRAFEEKHGFECNAFVCNFDSIERFDAKQLNSFLDMRAVYDPTGLAERMRAKIREGFDAFQHFLHVRGFWKQQWELAGEAAERMDRFDIKNEGLRLFLGGIWTLAAKEFRHSHEIYAEHDEPLDLEAYEFLLRIRSWIHLCRPKGAGQDPFGNHSEDVLDFGDFTSFGEMLGAEAEERARFEFANEVRARLLSARRRLASYSRGIMGLELHHGREVKPGSQIKLGASGLFHAPLEKSASDEERSRAALSVLREAQRYGLPVDPAELQGTFCGAGKWLTRVPELGEMFKDHLGSLADSFDFLSRVDGAMERLFPGYSRFETSMDARVVEGRQMRGALEREKMRALERYVKAGLARTAAAISPAVLAKDKAKATVELLTTDLDELHLMAVKLALKTKRLPVTPADERAREDASLPWQERSESGFSNVALADYFTGWEACGFSAVTLETTRFLIANRRAFKEHAQFGVNPRDEVEAFAKLCQNEQRLRALLVFTYADRASWESEETHSHRWWHSRELYRKTMEIFDPKLVTDMREALSARGMDEDQLAVLGDFGPAFFGSGYGVHLEDFASHLLKLAKKGSQLKPKLKIIGDVSSTMLAVATSDWPGLAACISGALFRQGIELRQAHLFSAKNQGLAFDFFHLHWAGALPADLEKVVAEAMAAREHIAPTDEAMLPLLQGRYTLIHHSRGRCTLKFETEHDAPGLVYALCYKTFRHLQGNIHGLTASTDVKRLDIVVHFNLSPGRAFDQAQRIVAGWG